jgi:hypothetical protein
MGGDRAYRKKVLLSIKRPGGTPIAEADPATFVATGTPEGSLIVPEITSKLKTQQLLILWNP